MNRARVWIGGCVALAAVWAVALGAMAWARSAAVTAEDVLLLVESQPLADLAPGDRAARLEQLADRVNRLPLEARRDEALQRALRDEFLAMTDAERSAYLDRTLPRGMTQMMDAINAMSPDKRRQMVDEALAQMRRDRSDPEVQRFEREVDEQTLQRIVDEGLRSYLRDASAQSKLDLQPLIEQMQVNMQELNRRPGGGPR